MLNDPFEFKMFVLDKERLEKYGGTKDFVENIVETHLNRLEKEF